MAENILRGLGQEERKRADKDRKGERIGSGLCGVIKSVAIKIHYEQISFKNKLPEELITLNVLAVT